MKSMLIVITGLVLGFGSGNENRTEGTPASVEPAHVLVPDVGEGAAIWAAVAGGKAWPDMFR